MTWRIYLHTENQRSQCNIIISQSRVLSPQTKNVSAATLSKLSQTSSFAGQSADCCSLTYLSFHPRSSLCCTGCWWCRACDCWTPATCTTRWCLSPPAVWPQPSWAGPRRDSPQWRWHLSWTSGLRSGVFLPGANRFELKWRWKKARLCNTSQATLCRRYDR